MSHLLKPSSSQNHGLESWLFLQFWEWNPSFSLKGRMIKGYVDRVFTNEFSYKYAPDKSVIPLMTGKTISFYCPMGGENELCNWKRQYKCHEYIIKNTFEFRGFEIKQINYYDLADREKYLNEIDI